MIGIDAGPLLGRGGISGYVGPLVRSLLAMDPGSQYRLVLRRSWLGHDGAGSLDGLGSVTRLGVPDRVLAFWWDHLGWSLPIQRELWGNLDVFLATCLMAPVLPRGRVVSIIYDLIPLRLPELFGEHRRFKSKVERVIRRSAAVIAISQRTKQDLVELLGVDQALVRVIYPGCGEAFRPMAPSEGAEVTSRYGIHGRYVLYVGALGPHKNVSTLLRAFELARQEGGLGARLVVVGGRRWGAGTQAVLKTLHVREDIVLTGEVPAEDLPALYAGAELFVFPSHYEGFGLPVLEAMACGVPVIVSNGGALPEVAGEAGLRVDPDNVPALAQAMCTVAGTQAIRTSMASASLQRAADFCWHRSATELLGLFRDVAGRKDDHA